jgi:hypothetical protein
MSFIKPARIHPSLTPSLLTTHLLSPSPHPLHLTNLISHYPALHKWQLSDDLSALRESLENREVEIEVGKRGRGYLDPDWQRLTMGFGESLCPDHTSSSK